MSRYTNARNAPPEDLVWRILDVFLKSNRIRKYVSTLVEKKILAGLAEDKGFICGLTLSAIHVLERKRGITGLDLVITFNEPIVEVGYTVARRLHARLIIGYYPPFTPPGADYCVVLEASNTLHMPLCFQEFPRPRLRRHEALVILPFLIQIPREALVSAISSLISVKLVVAPLCRHGTDNASEAKFTCLYTL
ncbi:hypothetical protein Hbut_1283 [Hyperthermus butylicus DSM 5456]|uniref:Uncharacterized protein n=1 Tax=Hyperthermus butylicus (strain DSM 5456 / JCM 9403 / PLM1-5) TaxID=415426 RepID=A2BMA2_HYPBU|nr:hypothetical protein Hbut_1283 [Hyperthermus butylicus DSM 5456]